MPDYKIEVAFTEEETKWLLELCRANVQTGEYAIIRSSCLRILTKRLEQLKANQKLTERLPRIEK